MQMRSSPNAEVPSGRFQDIQDHDAILSSLREQIDKHNQFKDDLRHSMQNERRSRRHREDSDSDSHRSMKFRFKKSVPTSRKRERRRKQDEHDRRHKSRKKDHSKLESEEETIPTHPFPREPVNQDHVSEDSQAAFRESLFDALADDEGAAYWESVYSQPIHIYNRPSVHNEQGELEQMNDEEYVAYVQTKMWERKHPEIVRERQRKERDRREDEEYQTKRREEFVRRKARAAWEEKQGWHDREGKDQEDGQSRKKKDSRYEHDFPGAPNMSSAREDRLAEFTSSWADYLTAWEKLKQELINEVSSTEPSSTKPAHRIPWPVLAGKTVVKPSIEEFMQNAPSNKDYPRLQILKSERVKWHPDKVQQRFRGKVDEGTMKIVTGVFQVIDELVETERKIAGG